MSSDDVPRAVSVATLDSPVPVAVNDRPTTASSTGPASPVTLSYPEDLAAPLSPAHSAASDAINVIVEENMRAMERRFETLLESFSDEMASEVEREQSHLLLMQDQVNLQRETMTKQLLEVQKRLQAEENQRSYVQQTVQDSNEQLRDLIAAQAEELKALKEQLSRLEGASTSGSPATESGNVESRGGGLLSPSQVEHSSAHWLSSLTSGVWNMFGACSAGGYSSAPAQAEAYSTLTKVPSLSHS
uniref:Uncharacterized protein n=1 Tax=Tetraselmis chuii TaxID=63592 RepID=A0A7S1SPG3_9CHLO|mmetsp:Transcript_21219/g.37803  ORF Transcript_21219/g.37803 Transcript_21219/m.37803 type:complete len:245 (+) Transcript_21219:206-940(+)